MLAEWRSQLGTCRWGPVLPTSLLPAGSFSSRRRLLDLVQPRSLGCDKLCPKTWSQPFKDKLPFTTRQGTTLTAERGRESQDGAAPSLAWFPQAISAARSRSLCVYVHTCVWLLPQMAFEPVGLFQPSLAEDRGSKTSSPYQVAKMRSHEHRRSRRMQGSAAGRALGLSEGCAWALPAPLVTLLQAG